MRRPSQLRDRLRSITFTPDAEQGFDDTRRRSPARPPRSEQRIDVALGAAFLAAATLLALTAGGRHVPVATAVVLVAGLAILSRVEVALGTGFAVPTELAVVPMLFLLPPAVVPLTVAAGLVVARMLDAAIGRRHLARVVVALSDSWF